jgi:class 3 adenylate cyclase
LLDAYASLKANTTKENPDNLGLLAEEIGSTANFAARVVSSIKGAEIWLSDRAKGDIDRLGAVQHKRLRWERHDGVAMKGFPGLFTLWAVQ